MTQREISSDLLKQVETFLYAEARLLEDNRFDEWLASFSEDARYWMPVRQNVDPSVNDESTLDTFALFDDDKQSLELRVLRVQTGEAHAEVPPSVTQRFITNIMAHSAAEKSFSVFSNFLVYQERRGLHGITFYGRREDVLRREEGTFKIQRRKIELAQTILPATISIFF
jgi:3-phenylpropionate/cinnamic acid dioxygenase small subunit